MKENDRNGCVIKPTLDYYDLINWRKKVASFLGFDNSEKVIDLANPDSLPVGFQVGPITGFTGDLENLKMRFLNLSKDKILVPAKFHFTNAEFQGLGHGCKLDNQTVSIKCMHQMLFYTNIMVGLLFGKYSMGTAEEIAIALMLGIPVIILEFDIFTPVKHASGSTSFAGKAERVFLGLDPENNEHWQKVAQFFKLIGKAMNEKKYGIGMCNIHGRTHYFEINGVNRCFHDLAAQTGLRKKTLFVQTLI